MFNGYCFINKDMIFRKGSVCNIMFVYVYYRKNIFIEICIEIFYELLLLCIFMNMYYNRLRK